MTAPGSQRADERDPVLALAAWTALALALARAAVLVGLGLAHHGDRVLAALRLGDAVPAVVLRAATVAALAALALALAVPARARRPLAAATVAVGGYLLLVGALGGDRSQRIGTDTDLGALASRVALAVALVTAVPWLLASTRLVRRPLGSAWLSAPVPLALLVLGALAVRSAGGLGAAMELEVDHADLTGDRWEVVSARPDAPPEPGLVCPSQEYRADGAARRALVLPPPALVRRQLSGDAPDDLRLVGAAGIDHGARAAGLAGHTLLFRVRVDGSVAFEERLPLAESDAWVPLGEDGLAVHGGALLELETRLLGPDGEEVKPPVPLRAGFGGLRLVERQVRTRARASREAPNVVLVLLDTLRADRTSAYGYERPTTPHLEALARRGVLFEEALATSSWTWPSTASILTGLQPEEHGVQDAASAHLARDLDTLAEALQRAGFTTGAWSGSPLIVPEKGFGQGFEFFDASAVGKLRRSDAFLPGALDWLGRAGEYRFFLYLHLMEPHAPLVPLPEGRRLFAADVPRGFDPRQFIDWQWELMASGFSVDGKRRTEDVVSPDEQRWIDELYDACVWSADHWLGRLVVRLEELDLLENTIIAVTSDHGEELFDHGLLAHAHTLHRELVRVPLVIAGPGVPVGQRVTSVRSGAALGPTLARLGGTELRGLESPADLLGDAPPGPVLFSTRQGWWNGRHRQPLFGLREGAAVLHYAPEGGPWGSTRADAPGEVRLYDASADPTELEDLAPADPARAAALRDELLERLSGLVRRSGAGEAPPDAATVEMLRKLGYVGDEE